MKTVLHWFRRDLRVADNVGLHAAAKAGERVYGLYVFDEAELKHPFAGAPRLAFALASLDSLSRNLAARGSQLLWRRGDSREIVPRVAAELGADLVTWNFDGEPDGFARDKAVRRALAARGIAARAWKDDVLHDAREVLKADGSPYVVFTPYAKRWRELPKEAPVPVPRFREVPRRKEAPLPTLVELGFTPAADLSLFFGGEKAGRDRLKEFLAGPVLTYRSRRDFPAVDGTSRLSPHLALGTLSPRTVFARTEAVRQAHPHAAAEVETFQKELIWREFYRMILWKFPHVAQGAFRPEYDGLSWENDPKKFAAWCAGRTGFPLVDAAMRQLNATGWMHNRLRMVASSFLTKDLLVSWQWGKRYFMQRLVDGDLASNNGSWQWSASTGTDAQPYFRIFNPSRQAEKFDPEGKFIAAWVPEAESLSYRPIVGHDERRKKAIAMFKP